MKQNNIKGKISGFSLIEISIVLIVVGLLLGGMMGPLGSQMERSQRNETEVEMDNALQAVYGFMLANGRLPCPDTNKNGNENFTGNRCSSARGNLPWATLATSQQDAWGQTFLYRVSKTFADRVDGTGCGTATVNVSFSLCSIGDIHILNKAGGSSVAKNIPAVIFSKGKNFSRATADEKENTDNDKVFVDKLYSLVEKSEYDDVVKWVVPGLMMNKMVNAGLLP